MRVSIVTLSFNQGQFLETALRSVIDQQYADLDYIVVDPGSTDESRSIIERYRPYINKVLFEPDLGPADGLNRGFSCADGEIFGFLNADDFLEPDVLKAVVRKFQSHADTDVIAGHGWLVDETGARIRRKHSNSFTAWRYLHRGAYLLQQSTFFRAKAYRATRGFNPENRSCWDGELWLDMALNGCRFKTVDQFWSAFRVYDQSISGSIARDRESREIYEMDRLRMFQRATGRMPKGSLYRSKRLAAEVLKWSSNPTALWYRLCSFFDPHARRAPI